ncbi:MAG: redoxin domain-containing protein [Bacteroidia bacterium]|nr:redoxin domain-containing protein [Bacteroidia bacterium]
MRFLCLSFLLLFAFNLEAQIKIEFEVSNYESDSLIVGYYIMDRQLVQDTVLRDDNGRFILDSNEDLAPGVYLLLLQPDNNFIQFLVNENDSDFKLKIDYPLLSEIQYESTPDKSAFQDYVDLVTAIRPTAAVLRDTIEVMRSKGQDPGEFEGQLTRMDDTVEKMQKDIVENYPGSVAALLLKANININTPEFEDTDEGGIQKYLYYRKHYFDNIELDNPVSLRTPFLHQRIDYYLNKLTPNHPDSICNTIDSLLHWMSPSEESFKYYLSHFLNTYAKSKIVGYDAIYVYLVDNYYSKGKAPWVEEENLLKLEDNANKVRPVLIGKQGPDITVYDEMNNPISISDIEYEYLVLLFWSPDCGHCKKTMPDFIEFDKKWRDRGIRTFAICSKHQEKVKDCWEYVKEKDMLGFINAADEFHKSRFKLKYNVQSTPKVFILDKNREILMKNVGGDQLDRVMEELLKRENEKE